MTAQTLSALLARYRLHLSFFVFLALVLEWQLNDGGRAHSLLAWQDVEHPAGMLAIVLGAMLRSWAAGIIRKQTALTTEGPYTLLRHPLYLGSFLMALGFAEVMEDRLALALVLVAIPLVYVSVIRNEERHLAARFGAAWNEYARRTGAILPRSPVRFSPGDWSWACWWRNREWRVVLRTAVILLLLEWWNSLAQGG